MHDIPGLAITVIIALIIFAVILSIYIVKLAWNDESNAEGFDIDDDVYFDGSYEDDDDHGPRLMR